MPKLAITNAENKEVEIKFSTSLFRFFLLSDFFFYCARASAAFVAGITAYASATFFLGAFKICINTYYDYRQNKQYYYIFHAFSFLAFCDKNAIAIENRPTAKPPNIAAETLRVSGAINSVPIV